MQFSMGGSRKRHFCMGGLLKMQFCCMGSLKCHFLYGRGSRKCNFDVWGSQKCHFYRDLENAIFCMGGLENTIFLWEVLKIQICCMGVKNFV